MIGPYARLRPGSVIGEQAKVGNFVEIKNTHLGKGAKANHLAYLGDADIGDQSNVGAGTITCNYDGANKHRTTLGDAVFVGSNSTLGCPANHRFRGFCRGRVNHHRRCEGRSTGGGPGSAAQCGWLAAAGQA